MAAVIKSIGWHFIVAMCHAWHACHLLMPPVIYRLHMLQLKTPIVQIWPPPVICKRSRLAENCVVTGTYVNHTETSQAGTNYNQSMRNCHYTTRITVWSHFPVRFQCDNYKQALKISAALLLKCQQQHQISSLYVTTAH
jgi:hypothetical protein